MDIPRNRNTGPLSMFLIRCSNAFFFGVRVGGGCPVLGSVINGAVISAEMVLPRDIFVLL